MADAKKAETLIDFGNAVTSSASVPLPSLSMATKHTEVAVHHDGIDPLSPDSDEALMGRVRNGDHEALRVLFKRYAPIVRGVAHRVLRDSFEADDLLQDIFLLIYRRCGQFDRSKGTVRFWILLMTHRRAISRRRYLTSRHFYTHSDLEEGLDRSSHYLAESKRYLEALEKKDILRSCFEELTQNQRETLALFFFDGYSFEEIAARLGQTTGNVRNHYYRGLERLRRKIFAEKTLEVRST